MKAILNLWGFEKTIEVSSECLTVRVPMDGMRAIPGARWILFVWDGEPGAVRKFRFESFLYPATGATANEPVERRWGRRKTDVKPHDWDRGRQGT